MDLSFWSYSYALRDPLSPCFNPCYDGFIILITPPKPRTSSKKQVSILVMMDLSFWCEDSSQQNSYLIRFNPCYDGFIILIFAVHQIVSEENESIKLARFQSLLWWIYHFDHYESLIAKANDTCFNPCYDGFIILIISSRWHWVSRSLRVSILVMMDLSFW